VSLLVLFASGGAPAPQYVDPPLVGAASVLALTIAAYTDAPLTGAASVFAPNVAGCTDTQLASGDATAFAPTLEEPQDAGEVVVGEVVGAADVLPIVVVDGVPVSAGALTLRIAAAIGGGANVSSAGAHDPSVYSCAITLRPGCTEAARAAYEDSLRLVAKESHKDLYVCATLLGGASGVLCGVAYFAAGKGPTGGSWIGPI
jgi:hypothetical protein